MFIIFMTSECTKNTQTKFTDTYIFIKKNEYQNKSCHVLVLC